MASSGSGPAAVTQGRGTARSRTCGLKSAPRCVAARRDAPHWIPWSPKRASVFWYVFGRRRVSWLDDNDTRRLTWFPVWQNGLTPFRCLANSPFAIPEYRRPQLMLLTCLAAPRVHRLCHVCGARKLLHLTCSPASKFASGRQVLCEGRSGCPRANTGGVASGQRVEIHRVVEPCFFGAAPRPPAADSAFLNHAAPSFPSLTS